MKKILLFIAAVMFLSLNLGCESYLDKSPDQGLTDADVYKDFASMRGFLDQCLNELYNLHTFGASDANSSSGSTGNNRTYLSSISDEFASLYNSAESKGVHGGEWLRNADSSYEIGCTGNTPISRSYKGIRITNRVLQDIDRVKGLTSQQHTELVGQAHFFRAWFYFQLIIRYGGMPKFDKLYQGNGDEDVPRMSYHQSHEWLISDLEIAISMLPNQWEDIQTGRPTRISAMALRSMAQLYDASPLMQNSLSSTTVQAYDQGRAAKAAQYAQAVIDSISTKPELGYRLATTEEYSSIFHWAPGNYTQPEYLWYNRSKTNDNTRYLKSLWLPMEVTGGTGNDAAAYNAPTQNMIDLFEVMGTDNKYYPIDHANAKFNDQDPYKLRDPRFYNNILYPGIGYWKNNQNTTIYNTLYEGGAMLSSLRSNKQTITRQATGYICKKFIWQEANQWVTGGYGMQQVLSVYIRLSQIYLDLAEASFYATGSATAKVSECSLSAEQALNIIRERAGITKLSSDIVADKDQFEKAIRRERGVELMFENHRWWDLRRWMIAYEVFSGAAPVKGIKAIPTNPKHNSVADKSTLTFNFETIGLTAEVRKFGMKNYWYPLPKDDVAGLNNLLQNPGW